MNYEQIIQVEKARRDSAKPENQVVSRKRVIDHGEVYTSEREVNAMLDLVKQARKAERSPKKRALSWSRKPERAW